MDEQEKDIALIEAYLEGSLSPEERHAFEARLAKEPELLKAVEFQHDLHAAIREDARQETKNAISAIHAEMIGSGLLKEFDSGDGDAGEGDQSDGKEERGDQNEGNDRNDGESEDNSDSSDQNQQEPPKKSPKKGPNFKKWILNLITLGALIAGGYLLYQKYVAGTECEPLLKEMQVKEFMDCVKPVSHYDVQRDTVFHRDTVIMGDIFPSE